MTLKEHLIESIGDPMYKNTWVEINVEDLDIINGIMDNPGPFLEFLTDKKAKKTLIKEIDKCGEYFSIEIPMTLIRILKGFIDFDSYVLDDTWASYFSDYSFDFINNLREVFTYAWKRDYQHIKTRAEYQEQEDEFNSLLKEANRYVDNIIKNCKIKIFFFKDDDQEQFDHDNINIIWKWVVNLEKILSEITNKLRRNIL